MSDCAACSWIMVCSSCRLNSVWDNSSTASGSFFHTVADLQYNKIKPHEQICETSFCYRELNANTDLCTEVVTCIDWNGSPVAKAVLLDVCQQLLVFFGSPGPSLHSSFVAARCTAHASNLKNWKNKKKFHSPGAWQHSGGTRSCAGSKRSRTE